jgi:uncharacterized protein with HEPN domain
MPSKNPAQRLCDIVENIDAIEAFTARMDFAAFAADRKTVYAVVRLGDHLGGPTHGYRLGCGFRSRQYLQA